MTTETMSMDDISAWPALGDPALGGLPPLSPGLKATATTNSVSSGSDDPNNPGWEMIEEEEEEEEGDAVDEEDKRRRVKLLIIVMKKLRNLYGFYRNAEET